MPKRRRVLLSTLLGISLLGAGTWFAVPRVLGPVVPAVEVARGPLVQTIVTTGRVRPPARAMLATLVTGKVVEIEVDEGDHVTAGQVVLRLDDTEAEAAVASAEARVADTAAQGRQVRTTSARDAMEAVKRAQARVDEAKRVHRRIQSLYADRVASQETLDESTTALALAESELRAAQIQRHDIRGTRTDRIEATRRQAEAELAAARARLQHHVLVSPFDGIVIERTIERGDVASAGTTVFVVVGSGETELVVEPDERNLALLALQQPAVASAEAFADQRFDATVSYIAPAVDPRRGTIEVRLAVPHPPDYLRPDMTVSAEIEVARRDDTLILSTTAVRDLASGEPWLLVVNDGVAMRRAVEVGIVGDDHVELVSGAEAGQVVIPSGVDVEPTSRVRARLDRK